MKPSVDISVVMATYNGELFIDKQLQSLSDQTVYPRELIVADDGSDDGTVAKVQSFAARAPFPVTLVRNVERLGYGGNFINAARRASSRYVAFCDQDDIWLPAKLETAVGSLEETGGDLFVHTAHLIDDLDRPIGFLSQCINRRRVFGPLQLAPWGVFYGFAMVFRKEMLDLLDIEHRGGHTFDHRGTLSHDLWIYFICSSLGTVVADDRPLALYRRHSANATPDTRGNLLRLLSQTLGLAAHPLLKRSDIARHRSEILDEFHRTSPGSKRAPQAFRAARYWEAISRYEASRTTLYVTAGVVRRAAACASLLAGGGYRAWSRGGLGSNQLLRDILTGVMRIRRPAAE